MRANCDRTPLLLNDKALADMNRFTYLGNMMSKDIDIKNRLEKAWGAFQKFTKILRSKGINIKTKIKNFQQQICTRDI